MDHDPSQCSEQGGGRCLCLLKDTKLWVRRGGTCGLLAVFLLQIATLIRAQDSQFFFDGDGNLLSQTGATSAPPQILDQPRNQVVIPGELASFCVLVADSGGLSYQWQFNGTNLAAATTDALLLTNVGATNEGQYSVVLVNG